MSTTTAVPRRRVRVGYLVSGLVCLGLAGVWALWAAGLAGGLSVSVLLPGVLVAAGVLGLLASVLSGRRPAAPTTLPAVPEPADPADPTDETRPYPTKES